MKVNHFECIILLFPKYLHVFKLYLTDDYNRVVLEPEEGVPDSDYINASYVDVSIFFILIPALLFPKCIPIFFILYYVCIQKQVAVLCKGSTPFMTCLCKSQKGESEYIFAYWGTHGYAFQPSKDHIIQIPRDFFRVRYFQLRCYRVLHKECILFTEFAPR